MKIVFVNIVIFLIVLNPNWEQIQAQQFFRISGEMTIKSKTPTGQQTMTIGSVFFDRNVKQIVYHISFPEPETWVTTDSLSYRILDDSIVSQHVSIGMAEFSIFNLALNSHLPNFGLKNSSYSISNVERSDDKVITTWTPPEHLKDDLGNILVSTREKELFGVIFLDSEGQVLRKQFFEEYFDISGLAFPGKIVEIGYETEGESYQISNFRKIKLDELENHSNYSYVLPGDSR